MAKIYGINGKITGKVGNTVFAVDGGIQVARQYNPIVANPRTTAQQYQRLKVNFAGQFSSGIVPAAIEALTGNGRARRSALLSNLIKDAMVTETVNGNVQIRFDAEKLILSTGNVDMPVLDLATSVSADDVSVTGTLSINPTTEGGRLPSGVRMRVVMIAVPQTAADISSDVRKGVMSRVTDVELSGESTLAVTEIFSPVVDPMGMNIAFYVIPLELVNAGALTPGYVTGGLDGASRLFRLPTSMLTNGAYNYGRSRFVNMQLPA